MLSMSKITFRVRRKGERMEEEVNGLGGVFYTIPFGCIARRLEDAFRWSFAAAC